ncbi:MAG TPA: class I SAM-dependent methyltransferase [Chitinophagaceae bacterium]|nr:class I SAM-dependent methyltransferase [Chitinophagaceae bacterium]
MAEKNTGNGDFDLIGRQTLENISKAKRFNKWMYSQIRPYIKGAVLEIGSGIGNISRHIIEDGIDITLSEYNLEYCELLQKAFSKEPHVKGIFQVDLLLPDFTSHFAMLKEKFDTIILLNVIEHLENDSIAVANCSFMLKAGGHFIVLAPAYKWLYCKLDKELGHYRRYSMKKIRSTIKNQTFEIIARRHFNVFGISGWFIFGKIFRKKALGREMRVFEFFVPLAKLLDKICFNKIGLSIIVTGKKIN